MGLTFLGGGSTSPTASTITTTTARGLLPAPVVASCMVNAASTTVAGIDTTPYGMRATFKAACEFSDLQVFAPGFVNNTSTGEAAPGTWTYKFALEMNGTTYPLLFEGGVRSRTIAPYGSAFTLPLGVTIAKDALFAIRTEFLSDVSTTIPTGPNTGGPNHTTNPPTGDGRNVTGGIDTFATAFTSATNLAPVVVCGRPTTTQPSVFSVGDSITFGTGDTSSAYGWVARAITGLGYGLLRYAQSGQTLVNMARQPLRYYSLLGQSTHAIVSLGNNDMGTSLAANKVNLISVWKRIAARGAKVVACTLTPRTTSTDGWTTLANQTLVANYEGTGTRGLINDWIRDGAPMVLATGAAAAIGSNAAGTVRIGQTGHPVVRYWDLADTVESARNSGLWRIDLGALTADGSHPNPAGHALLAAIPQAAHFA